MPSDRLETDKIKQVVLNMQRDEIKWVVLNSFLKGQVVLFESSSVASLEIETGK